MSIREFFFSSGTKLRLKGNDYEGMIGLDSRGFDFDKAVTQNEIIELTSSECNSIDLQEGNIFKVTLDANISSFSVTNGDVGTYIFIFEQDSTGARTVTFDGNFYFENAAGAPDFSADAADVINIVSFLCDGTNYYGSFMTNFVAV